ncbi:MAG: hypothetical protein JSW73_02010 [Candidatus Woesearchaeota archaeon]|nr:MAG: hypothetical protein JSW73_02010 [Candidatus Woesearchaeota archaeon]
MNKSLENFISEDSSSIKKDIDQILFEKVLDIYAATLDPRMNPTSFACGDLSECETKDLGYLK